MTNLYCIGCGAQIQDSDAKQLGYIPKSALEKRKENEEIYCQRCFRLRHYNEVSDIKLNDDDFLKLLNQIRNEDALVVNVIDIFDFSGSIIPSLHRFVGSNPILLVANKVDVLPKSLKKTKIRDWILREARNIGLKPLDVILTSAKSKKDIQKLLLKIEQYRNKKDVYVVGVTNVGKSTLINRIISQKTGIKDLITTSRFPGTTLDKIEIPLNDGKNLIDTPGIIHNYQMAHFLSAKDLDLISPKKEIKPKTYQLSSGQTLFMGGLARFDYLKGPNGVVLYFDNNLKIHRTKTENATRFYQKHLGSLLTPPNSKEVKNFPELTKFEFRIKEKSDLVFSGLGWITVKKGSIVAGYAPKGVSIIIRKAMI